MIRRQSMVVISLAGLFLGVYLTLYHYGVVGELACNIGSCERVQTSRWSSFLGLPVAAWGAGFYALMLVLAVVGMQPAHENSRRLAGWMLVLSVWGVIFTLWLTSLEAFVIHAWCEWCLGSAAMVLVLCALCFFEWRSVREAGA
jgi:uncharacterized membrane protein